MSTKCSEMLCVKVKSVVELQRVAEQWLLVPRSMIVEQPATNRPLSCKDSKATLMKSMQFDTKPF